MAGLRIIVICGIRCCHLLHPLKFRTKVRDPLPAGFQTQEFEFFSREQLHRTCEPSNCCTNAHRARTHRMAAQSHPGVRVNLNREKTRSDGEAG